MRRRFLAPCLLLLACGCRPEAPQAQAPVSVQAPAPAPPDPSRIPDIATWQVQGPPRVSFAGPHRGSRQRVFLNAAARQALDADRFHPWPEGAQLVKEALDEHDKRIGWFWMSKEQGQWVWAQAGPDGKVEERLKGLENSCAACHTTNAARFDGSFAPVFAGKGTLNIPIK